MESADLVQLPAIPGVHRSGTTGPNALPAIPVGDPFTPFESLFNKWLVSLPSTATQRAYTTDMRAWVKFLTAGLVDPLEARREHADLWVQQMKGNLSSSPETARALRPSTIARRLATLESFYRYAAEAGAIDRSPVALVRRPRTGEGYVELTPGLDRDEVLRLLDAATRPKDRALVLLLALNGLRVSEALSLQLDAISTVRGHTTVLLRGKGAREDRIPLPPAVVDAIEQVRISEGRTTGPVFVGSRGRTGKHPQMTTGAAAAILASLARRAGLSRPVTPHMLRVAAITAALDAGASLRDVQDLARHADPRTTRRYDRNRGALDRHASYVLAGWFSKD